MTGQEATVLMEYGDTSWCTTVLYIITIPVQSVRQSHIPKSQPRGG